MSLLEPTLAEPATAEDFQRQAAERVTPLGEYLGAKLSAGLEATRPAEFGDLARLPPRYAADEYGLMPSGPPPSPLLSKEQFDASIYKRPGLEWEEGETEARADARAAAHDRQAWRDSLVARSDAGWAGQTAGFALGLGAAALDPTNYVPLLGPAAKAAMVARFGRIGGSLLLHGSEAALNTGLFEPLAGVAARAEGRDYGWEEAGADILTNALGGAVLGTAAGEAARALGFGHDLPKPGGVFGEPEAPGNSGLAAAAAAREMATGRPAAPPAPSLDDMARRRGVLEGQIMGGMGPSPWGPFDVMPYDELRQVVGRDGAALAGVQAHGIAGADPEHQLDALLTGGIDKGRAFHTGPLGQSGDPTVRAGGLGAKVDAPYVLLGAPGERMKEGGIRAVVVNGAAKANLDDLKARYPGVAFLAPDEVAGWAKGGRAAAAPPEVGAGVVPRRPGRPPLRVDDLLRRADAANLVLDQTDRGEPVDVGKVLADDPALRAPIERPPAPRRQAAGEDVAITSAGRRVPIAYDVVEARDLIASHTKDMRVNPAFPAELQPRDRTRAASGTQVAAMASKLDPALLGRSATASEGAPIVGPDGVVESGNARVLAVGKAYREGLSGSAAYRRFLVESGHPEAARMEAPVLVRRRTGTMTPDERAAFTREANVSGVAAMGTAERANADAAALRPDHLEMLQSGDMHAAGNRPFVRAFLGTLPEGERGGLLTAAGALSKAGGERLRNAVLAKAFGDAGLVARLAEEPDSGLNGLGRALAGVAPEWAKMRAEATAGQIAPEGDGTAGLLEALHAITAAQAAGNPPHFALDQGDMLGGGLSRDGAAFLRAFLALDHKGGSRVLGREKLAAVLERYVAEARKQQPGVDMFGNRPATPAEILEERREPMSLATATPEPPHPSVAEAAQRVGKDTPELETFAKDAKLAGYDKPLPGHEPKPETAPGEPAKPEKPPTPEEKAAATAALPPELGEVEAMRREGSLTPADEATLAAGEAEAQKAEGYADAWRTLVACVVRNA